MILKDILEMLRKDWRTAIKDMEAIARVRELHKSETGYAGSVYCSICLYETENLGETVAFNENYPCPTIKALDGEQ